MLKKIKELVGMERIIFETLAAMILASALYLAAYLLSGGNDVTSLFVLGTVFVINGIVSVATGNAFIVPFLTVVVTIATIFASAVALIFIASVAVLIAGFNTNVVVNAHTVIHNASALITIFGPVVEAVVVTIFGAVLSAFAAIVVAREYKVRYWKVLLIFFAEVGLLVLALRVCVPYLCIGLLIVALAVFCVILFRKRSAVAPAGE
jgi:hypothetical protein